MLLFTYPWRDRVTPGVSLFRDYTSFCDCTQYSILPQRPSFKLQACSTVHILGRIKSIIYLFVIYMYTLLARENIEDRAHSTSKFRQLDRHTHKYSCIMKNRFGWGLRRTKHFIQEGTNKQAENIL